MAYLGLILGLDNILYPLKLLVGIIFIQLRIKPVLYKQKLIYWVINGQRV